MTPATKRRATGVYYTPQPIVEYIVRQTLDPLVKQTAQQSCRPRILDPSCGDGAFLKQAFRHLQASSLDGCFHAGEQLFGVDVDGPAAAAARQALLRMAAVEGATESKSPPSQNHVKAGHEGSDQRRKQVFRIDSKTLSARLRRNIRCGDALIGPDFSQGSSEHQAESPLPPVVPFCWRTSFPEVFAAGGFDAIVGNPPYVNIRLLTKTRGQEVKRYLEARFRCARRAYDLYVLFLEQALALLRPGGMCGMIVPNKIATLEYALPCRALLLEQTALHEVTDASELRVFPDAGVYPYILVFQKQSPPADHRTKVYCLHSIDDLLQPQPPVQIRQRDLTAESGFQIHGQLDVEARVSTLPLADRATLHSGTTGFVAQKVAAALKERCDVGDEPCFDFIVSRNIDRFVIRRGTVRFMKRNFQWPVLPVAGAGLTERKRRLFAGPKIVLAGLSRRLEAALDERGLALGVQVYAACAASEDLHYLLGLLNSKLLSYLFGIRYRAKRLAGGYLAVNKSQLASLPIRVIREGNERDTRLREQLIQQVNRMLTLCTMDRLPPGSKGSGPGAVQATAQEIDRAIDQLVYELYDLTDAEIRRVEDAISPTIHNFQSET